MSRNVFLPLLCPLVLRYLVWYLMLSFISIVWRISPQKKCLQKATSVTIRCEQGTKGRNSLDVWLGRLAMVGFAVAISVEISTGKGLLEVWHALCVFSNSDPINYCLSDANISFKYHSWCFCQLTWYSSELFDC